MGQKINPTGFRLSVNKNWDSRWFAKTKDFSQLLKQDIDIRNFLQKKLNGALIGKIVMRVLEWSLVKRVRGLNS